MVFFFSFAVHHVLLIFLSLALFHVRDVGAAGSPLNTTLSLNSPGIAFTQGWNVATFNGTEEFAFANAVEEQVQVTLPANTSAVFYQGFEVKGGGLYYACIDCTSTTEAGTHLIVNAHDDAEDGTQPPITLFSFTDLDQTVLHVLNVFNLVDDNFNHTSQITFASVIVTTGGTSDNSTTSVTAGGTSGGVFSTVIVSTNDPQSTVAPPSTSTSGTAASTTSVPGNSVAPVSPSDTTTDSGTVTSTAAAPTSTTSTANSQSTDSSQSTQTTNSVGATSTSPGDSAPTGSSTGGSGTSQTQNPSSASSNPTATSGSSQTGGTTVTLPSTASGAAGSQPTSGSGSGSGGSGTSTSAGTGGSSAASNSGASTSGVSKPVIIVVAVIASLVVLGLLAAITWLLVRNGPPPANDPERGAGLMREAAPVSVVSGPVGLAPTRPQNPFADTVPADIPLDEPVPPFIAGATAAEVLAAPPPRPPPPPLPPKSPLRNTFNSGGNRTPWISRVPRTPSPTSPV